VVRVGFGAGDLVAGELTGGDRVEPLDALCGFAVSDRLDLERVQLAELGDLVERQRRVIDQPDGGRLWHEQLLSHGYSPCVVRAGVAGRGSKPLISGNWAFL
jgi:hypothetical protein